MNPDSEVDYTLSIITAMVLVGVVITIMIWNPPTPYKKPVYSYMAEIDGINYSVDYCNLEANVLTYTQNDLTVNQMCTDCKCQVRVKDDN